MPVSLFASSLGAIVLSVSVVGCGGKPSRQPESPDSVAPNPAVASVGSPLAAAAAALAGTWRCSGVVHGPDGASPSEVTLVSALDLDEAWLQTQFAVVSGAYKYDFTAHRRFDTSSSQWVNVIVDNFGGYAVSRSNDGSVWTGESSGPMGAIKIKDTEASVSPGEMRMDGQYSPDGKVWRTGYDLSCKKLSH